MDKYDDVACFYNYQEYYSLADAAAKQDSMNETSTSGAVFLFAREFNVKNSHCFIPLSKEAFFCRYREMSKHIRSYHEVYRAN